MKKLKANLGADIKISGTRTLVRWIQKLENISWDPRIPKFDTSVASAAFGTTSSSRLQLFLFLFLLVPQPTFFLTKMHALYRSAVSCHWILLVWICVAYFSTCTCVREVEGRKDWIEIMVYNSPARKTRERTLPSGFLFPLLFVSFSFSSPSFVFLDFYRGYGVNKNIPCRARLSWFLYPRYNWFLG